MPKVNTVIVKDNVEYDAEAVQGSHYISSAENRNK